MLPGNPKLQPGVYYFGEIQESTFDLCNHLGGTPVRVNFTSKLLPR
jgi:hypothetical protein